MKGDLERPVPVAGARDRRRGVHPVSVIEEAEGEWMRRWGRISGEEDCVDVRALLCGLPQLAQQVSMTGKAAGPDQWLVEAWLLFPDPFVAELL